MVEEHGAHAGTAFSGELAEGDAEVFVPHAGPVGGGVRVRAKGGANRGAAVLDQAGLEAAARPMSEREHGDTIDALFADLDGHGGRVVPAEHGCAVLILTNEWTDDVFNLALEGEWLVDILSLGVLVVRVGEDARLPCEFRVGRAEGRVVHREEYEWRGGLLTEGAKAVEPSWAEEAEKQRGARRRPGSGGEARKRRRKEQRLARRKGRRR